MKQFVEMTLSEFNGRTNVRAFINQANIYEAELIQGQFVLRTNQKRKFKTTMKQNEITTKLQASLNPNTPAGRIIYTVFYQPPRERGKLISEIMQKKNEEKL